MRLQDDWGSCADTGRHHSCILFIGKMPNPTELSKSGVKVVGESPPGSIRQVCQDWWNC